MRRWWVWGRIIIITFEINPKTFSKLNYINEKKVGGQFQSMILCNFRDFLKLQRKLVDINLNFQMKIVNLTKNANLFFFI